MCSITVFKKEEIGHREWKYVLKAEIFYFEQDWIFVYQSARKLVCQKSDLECTYLTYDQLQHHRCVESVFSPVDLLKASKFQNENMKLSQSPKYEPHSQNEVLFRKVCLFSKGGSF